jgi:hypothetical protein
METKNMEPRSSEVLAQTAPWLRGISSGFADGVPLAIIVLGILLLQSHSLRFWDMAVGPWIGWGWSVLLELISLWLWYRPRSGVIAWWAWRAVALTTTGLLLTGPLYQVSAPLFAESVLEQALDQQIARAERSLETYQENSRMRAGWQGKIDQTETELARLWSVRWKRSNPDGLEMEGRRDWQRRAILVLQIVSILVVQAAVVLAITTVSAGTHSVAGEREFVETHDSEALAGPAAQPIFPITSVGAVSQGGQLVTLLQEAVRRRLATGQSYADIEQETGIQKPYLSLLMNHFARQKRGDRVLGEDALRRIKARLSTKEIADTTSLGQSEKPSATPQ